MQDENRNKRGKTSGSKYGLETKYIMPEPGTQQPRLSGVYIVAQGKTATLPASSLIYTTSEIYIRLSLPQEPLDHIDLWSFGIIIMHLLK